MQIYGPSQVHGAQPINGPHTSRPAQPSAVSGASSTGDSLDISAAGQIAGRMSEIPEIRADRVQQLREAIESGTYETDAKLETAIDRLLDEIA